MKLIIDLPSFAVFSTQSLCECRCKLIEQQRRLCSSEKLDVEKIIANFQMILLNLPKQAAKSTTIVQSVLREVEGWFNLMKTYFALGKCRYVCVTQALERYPVKRFMYLGYYLGPQSCASWTCYEFLTNDSRIELR